jgi:hypothetical protein
MSKGRDRSYRSSLTEASDLYLGGGRPGRGRACHGHDLCLCRDRDLCGRGLFHGGRVHGRGHHGCGPYRGPSCRAHACASYRRCGREGLPSIFVKERRFLL